MANNSDDDQARSGPSANRIGSRLETQLTSLAASISFLMLVGAGVLGVAAYLAFSHPSINYKLAEETERARVAERVAAGRKAESEAERLREWRRFLFRDVAVTDEKYPLVVMRTGFKVLRLEGDKALVGWRFDVVNTSPTQEYEVSVNYTIEDRDEFSVASSAGSTRVRPQEFGAVTATLTVDTIDLNRLHGENWSVGVAWNDRGWNTYETTTEGTRYERLAAIPAKNWPRWASDLADNPFRVLFSEKWEVARDVLHPVSDEQAPAPQAPTATDAEAAEQKKH